MRLLSNVKFVGLCMLLGLASGERAHAAVVSPVTSGLLVGMDGTQVLADANNKVQVWYDQIGGPNAADQQDFGNTAAATGRYPTLVSTLMPNGTTHNVLDFTPGTSGNSDFFLSKQGGTGRTMTFGDAFASGADIAYDDPTGLTFMVVFKFDPATLASRSLMRGDYFVNGLNTSSADVGAFAAASGLGVNVRNNANASGNQIVPVSSNFNDWYILGGVWDSTTQTVQAKLFRQDGTTTVFPAAPANIGAATYTDHVLTYLGANPASIEGQSWDGQMAEFLFFNAALSDTQYGQVQSYLNNKYFTIVPEPGSCVLLGISVIGLAFIKKRISK